MATCDGSTQTAAATVRLTAQGERPTEDREDPTEAAISAITQSLPTSTGLDQDDPGDATGSLAADPTASSSPSLAKVDVRAPSSPVALRILGQSISRPASSSSSSSVAAAASPSSPAHPSAAASATSNSAQPLPSSMPSATQQVDEAILQALRNSRDRVFFIQHEREMAIFVKDPTRQRLDLPLMNTYQRLLVHRCADQFHLDHQLDPTTKAVSLVKTSETRMPDLRISQRAAALFGERDASSGKVSPAQAGTPPLSLQSASTSTSASASTLSDGPSPGSGPGSALASADSPVGAVATPPAGFRIMRRNPTASSRGSLTPAASNSGSNSESERSDLASVGKTRRKDRKHMTIEEREAAYKAARERIFGVAEAQDSTKPEQKDAPSVTAAPRTGGASSKDERSGSRQGAKKKASSAHSSVPASLNGSTDSFNRGRASGGSKAEAGAPLIVDDDLGFRRHMMPPSSSAGLWTPNGQVQVPLAAQQQPHLSRQKRDGPTGFASNPAVAAQTLPEGQIYPMPHYMAGPNGGVQAQYAYAAAGFPPQQPQMSQMQPYLQLNGRSQDFAAAAGTTQVHLRAKAPAFLPPSGHWGWVPEASTSRASSTPGSDGSVGGAAQRPTFAPAGQPFHQGGGASSAERDAFSPFPPSNPSSVGGSRSASTSSSSAGGGPTPSGPPGATAAHLSSDQFPALSSTSHSARPNASSQGAWNKGSGSGVLLAGSGTQPSLPTRGPNHEAGYPSSSLQHQWYGSNDTATWSQQQQQQQPLQQHQQHPPPYANLVNGSRHAGPLGVSGYAMSPTGQVWNPSLPGAGRFAQRAFSPSGNSVGSAGGGGGGGGGSGHQTLQQQPKDDSMSVTSASSSRSSQPHAPSTGPVSHPSLPLKPAWIQKNGTGSEATTSTARPPPASTRLDGQPQPQPSAQFAPAQGTVPHDAEPSAPAPVPPSS